MVVVTSAAMVAQPSFIFGDDASRGDNYILGVELALLLAALVGIFNVLSAKYKEVPTGIFMTIGGLTSLILGLIHCFKQSQDGNNLLPDTFQQLPVLCIMSILSLGGILHQRLAVLFINPVLISMLRTTEIVMSLLLEVCLLHGKMDFASKKFIYNVIGSILVIISAVLMSMSDYINGYLGKICKSSVKILEEEQLLDIKATMEK